ncbi:hypothetical protein D3C84_794390 [compost metagenome]
MGAQVLRFLWRAAPGHVRRGCAHGQGVVDERAGNQGGRLQGTQAKGHVQTVFEHVRTTVGEHHVEFYPRVEQGKFAQGRRQFFRAEGQGRRDAQGAAGFIDRLLGQAFRVCHQPQHFEAALVIRGAEFGQPLAPGGAVEQAHTQALLEGLEVIADHGGGHFALRSGAGHAAGFHHFDVHGHCLEQVHYQARL